MALPWLPETQSFYQFNNIKTLKKGKSCLYEKKMAQLAKKIETNEENKAQHLKVHESGLQIVL